MKATLLMEGEADPGLTAQRSALSGPLYVDLDGTLLRTDLLLESVLGLLRKRPWSALLLPFWLLRGKAHLKRQVALRASIDPSTLPYQEAFLGFLRAEAGAGRTLVLATASDELLAQRVADHVGIFSSVLASDGRRNLSGRRKLDAILSGGGEEGFDYAGNGRVDLPIWARARGAVVVNANASVARRAGEVSAVLHTFSDRTSRLSACLRALRPHQWLKNLLLAVPLIMAHKWQSADPFLRLGLGFLSFGLCASAFYLFNDLLDLSSDRAHPRKKARPLAAGDLPIPLGIALLLGSCTVGFALAATLGKAFLLALLTYVVLSLSYSLYLKTFVLLDVLVLACLYTIRIVAGAAVVDVPVSFWILAFSVFMFFNLAILKRCAELRVMEASGSAAARGRDYGVRDRAMLESMGIASGYLAVLVVAMFINSPEISTKYRRPELLWALCPILLYWVSRVWLKAGRGEMHDDPVVFALRDRGSRYVLAATLAIILGAV